MMSVVKYDDDKLKAFMEYLIFDDYGEIDLAGCLMLIGDLYINPGERAGKLWKKMLVGLLKEHPRVMLVRYTRLYKFPDRPGQTYTREQILKRFGGRYE